MSLTTVVSSSWVLVDLSLAIISSEPSLFTAVFRREITSAKGTSVSNLTSFAVNGITDFDMQAYRECGYILSSLSLLSESSNSKNLKEWATVKPGAGTFSQKYYINNIIKKYCKSGVTPYSFSLLKE